MLKKWTVLLISCAIVLSACRSPVYNQTENNTAQAALKTKQARHRFDARGKTKPALVMNQGAYVDTSPISLSREPAWLKNRIVIRGDQLPFSYYSRIIAQGAGTHILTKYQTGLDPATNITVNYSGSVRGALDLLAAKTGYTYSIHTNSVFWQAFVTKTFDIAFMPGGTEYLMGKSSGGGSSSSNSGGGGSGGSSGSINFTSTDASSEEYSSLKGTLSIWKDLDTTIRQLLSADGRLMVSESTTSITVRDRPTNVDLIEKFISNLNRNLSKQVLVKIQVLEVNLNNDYTFGIDWQVITKAFHNSPFLLNGSYGTPLSIQALTPQSDNPLTGATVPVPQFGTQGNGKKNSYTILINALNQQGKASVVSEPRVLCLNNQVSVIQIVTQQAYLASVQNTTLAGGGGTGSATTNVGTVTSQLTPGTLTSGLTLYILPKILKDKVYLQVNADISRAGPFQTIESGSSGNITTLQLPVLAMKHFNQRSMIKSGDTLILAGFRELTNQANANQLLSSQALGGKASSELSKETIILITPIVLNGSA